MGAARAVDGGGRGAAGDVGDASFCATGAATRRKGYLACWTSDLGKASIKQVPVDEIAWMLDQYGAHYRGWNVKRFHEHIHREHNFNWSYTWTKMQLHAAGLVDGAARRGAHRRKRPRKPCVGMMLHQDASRFAWLAGQPELDLVVTLDDANNEIYSAFLVEEEGTASTLRACLEVLSVKGMPSSIYTDRGSHYFFTPKAGEKVDARIKTQVGHALEQLGIEHLPPFSPEARGQSERMFSAPCRAAAEGAEACRDQRDEQDANRYISTTSLRRLMRVSSSRRRSAKARSLSPTQHCFGRSSVSRRSGSWLADNTVAYAGRRLQLPPEPGTSPLRQGPCQGARVSGRGARRVPMVPGCWHAMTPPASPSNKGTRGRPREPLRPGKSRLVGLWTTPRGVRPQAPQAKKSTDRSGQLMCYKNRTSPSATDTPYRLPGIQEDPASTSCTISCICSRSVVGQSR